MSVALGAPLSSGDGGVSGPLQTLSHTDIMDVVMTKQPEVAACIALKKEKTPPRIVSIRWTIRLDGGVERAESDDSGPVVECLKRRSLQWRFPSHRTPTKPFDFPIKF